MHELMMLPLPSHSINQRQSTVCWMIRWFAEIFIPSLPLAGITSIRAGWAIVCSQLCRALGPCRSQPAQKSPIP